MSAAQRFTFDLDLARIEPANKVLPETEFEGMLAAARQEGYEAGLRAGQTGVEARSAEALANAAQKLADDAAGMIDLLDTRQKRNLKEAVDLAASIARKLAGHLIARQPQAEMTALIGECMASLEQASHLVVRCHPDLCDAMQQAAQERMASSGFSGRLVVLGDPEIGLGDGRLEWADGGLVRDIEAISSEINTRVSAYLAARGGKEGE